MSVVLVVQASEGLVLAADSAATLQGQIEHLGKTQKGVLKTYYNARKILRIGDFPIGVATWGIGFVGLRTIESLVRQWEYNENWDSLEAFKIEHKGIKYAVEDCAKGLLKHFKCAYDTEFAELDLDKRPLLGMIVAGYSEGDFFPKIWSFRVPTDKGIHDQRPDVDGRPNFGASWFGLTDAIIRLHFGRDDAVPRILEEKFGIPQTKVREALEPLQYPIPYQAMPLQDVIDYAYYMVKLSIDRYRFVIGPEMCGGKVDIAAITQRGFKWISHKQPELNLEGT